jgi:hypothetical protein
MAGCCEYGMNHHFPQNAGNSRLRENLLAKKKKDSAPTSYLVSSFVSQLVSQPFNQSFVS